MIEIEEDTVEKNASKVIKKFEICKKAEKNVDMKNKEVSQKCNLSDKFEIVLKGKKEHQRAVQDRVSQIFERRSQKD